MRGIIVLAMFTASLAHAAWSDYEELRELKLDATRIQALKVDAGSGSMKIKGLDGSNEIVVLATIAVPGAGDEKAQKLINEKMTLTLERHGDSAQLKSMFADGIFGTDSNASIALDITVPPGISIDVDDGAGSIDIFDVAADVSVTDGAGSIEIRNIANLRIDDGSGSIEVVNASGNVVIDDGSGSIRVRHVNGSVTVEDGSGSINVSDVDEDLIIVDDGSGGLRFSDIRGRVDAET